MPFNSDLTVACQPILIADSRDNNLSFDFLSPESNRVLVTLDELPEEPHEKHVTAKRNAGISLKNFSY